MSITAPTAQEIGLMRFYWEDVPVGFKYETATRTITEADVVGFAALTADFNRMHVDAEFAAKSPFGRRIAHGMLVVSYMSGLNSRTTVNQLLEASMVAVVNVQCQFLKPTFIGDTISCEIEVIESRESSRPDRGLITFQRIAKTGDGEAKVRCIVKMILMRRPQADSGQE